MNFLEIILVIILILLIICYNINRILDLPPGPTPWLFLGNIPQLSSSDLDKRIMELKKEYGGVFTLWMPYPTVIIGEHEALKRTIIREGDLYAGRPDLFVMFLLIEGNYGLAFEENEWYRPQRRFTLHTLRNLGVGKAVIKIADKFNEPKMLLLDMLPFLRHFDRFLGFGLKRTIQLNDIIMEFVQKQFDEHKKAINYDQEPMNYVDAYLHELHRRENDGGVDGFTEKQGIAAIYDLFSTGMETIVTSLRFCFLYLLNYPQIQEKIHKEIDDNLGTERDITVDDQKILPYTCAFIQEVFRVGYILYTNLFHMTLDDVNCEGYKLRKGTRIIPQYQCVHMDESIYPRPELLIPERHLKDGQFVKDDRITPFAMGKRSCLGESLARMEMFMFFATMMQKFRFEPEAALYPPEVKLRGSSIRGPAPFKIRVIDRTVTS